MKQLMFDWEQEDFAENSKYGVSLLYKVYQLRRILDFLEVTNRIHRTDWGEVRLPTRQIRGMIRSPKSEVIHGTIDRTSP